MSIFEGLSLSLGIVASSPLGHPVNIFAVKRFPSSVFNTNLVPFQRRSGSLLRSGITGDLILR